MPPRKRPWLAAYIGAVVAAIVGLKIVTRAKTVPIPMPVNIKIGLGIFQLIAAVAKQRANNIPVLLTVPSSVIFSDTGKSLN